MSRPSDRERPKPWALAHEAYDAARDLDDSVLMCRDLRHYWTPRFAKEVDFGWYRILVCERCGTERHEEYSHTMVPAKTWMVYPKGYSITGLGPQTQETRAGIRQAARERTWRLG